MCPSALSILGPGGEGAGVKPGPKLTWTGGDVRAKFHQGRCRGLDFH